MKYLTVDELLIVLNTIEGHEADSLASNGFEKLIAILTCQNSLIQKGILPTLHISLPDVSKCLELIDKNEFSLALTCVGERKLGERNETKKN